MRSSDDGGVPRATVALRRVHALELRMSRLRAEQVLALADLVDAAAMDV